MYRQQVTTTGVRPFTAALVLVVLAVCPPARVQAQPPPAEPSDRVAAAAARARDENRLAEAAALYRQALATQPDWGDGWWQLGTVLYDADQYAEAAAAFEKAASLTPASGMPLVMLGLSEFRLGRRDDALAHIERGRALGTSADPQFRQVMLYHEGLLLIGASEFERAQESLDAVAADGADSDDLLIALGLSVLRMREDDLAAGSAVPRTVVSEAGTAERLAALKRFDEAQRAYEQLAAEHPRMRNVHYALGRFFVVVRQPEAAVHAFERELQVTPDHVPARLSIAAIKAETDPAAALPFAEEAVRLNGRIPLGHYLLGSLLLHTPDTARAISELETAEAAVQGDPGVYYALARAYARAGRDADAVRARARFKQLTEERQAAARRAAAKDRP